MTFAYLNYNPNVKSPAHRTAVFLLPTALRNPKAAPTRAPLLRRSGLEGPLQIRGLPRLFFLASAIQPRRRSLPSFPADVILFLEVTYVFPNCDWC
jgi:hypothetical protein